MSRVGKWMTSYWDMVSRSAAWSSFPDMAHEIYGAKDEGEEAAQTAADGAMGAQDPTASATVSPLPEAEG